MDGDCCARGSVSAISFFGVHIFVLVDPNEIVVDDRNRS
jgi:hypothetical protein